jgi:hypothetical protein
MEESTAVATSPPPLPLEVVETVVSGGDLSSLTAGQRAEYYGAVCRSLGLNPLTKPFEYLDLNGELRLYALRDCADQLRRLLGISIYIANRERMNDLYIVTARAKDRQGREDESMGAVTVGNLEGDALANALMKAETKAKRRVTLSIAGLGWLDETEFDPVPQSPSVAVPAQVSPPEGHPTADHISTLLERARSCGVDLPSFGDHLRRLMQLADDTKITKKFLRESMTLAQYEVAWQHYGEMLKPQVEEPLSDDPPPGEKAFLGGPEAITGLTEEGPQTETSAPDSAVDAPADGPYATPQQIAALKRLAQQVGDEADAGVHDMLDHHPEGGVLGVYELVKPHLSARKAAKKADTSVSPHG